MLSQLLASYGWVIDVIALLILIGGLALGSNQGFIKSVCKIAGTITSIVIAVIFCVSFRNFLESTFGMTSAIAEGIANGYVDKQPYMNVLTVDVLGSDIKQTLIELGVGFFPRLIIDLNFSDSATISAGTSVAQMMGAAMANWITIVIAFVILFLVVRLGFYLLSLFSTHVVEKCSPLRFLNRLLGGLFGLLEGMLLIFVLLAICSYLPVESLHSFVSSSPIIGKIFTSEWFAAATGYMISGQWFRDLTAGLLY